ncbi:MAG TPA: 2OG-Fe(II) oxygenase family protein [Candidatus Nanoarchaeia archaeon]|nr:2OG-Fe(II) oxygenase family protein [Candidatus Nanoarchaeia archaeon]
MLDKWINKKYLDEKEILKIRKTFFISKPYPNFELKDFFTSSKIEKLRKEVLKEQFSKQDRDLFSFSNTKELNTSKSGFVMEFYAFLMSGEFLELMGKLTGEKLNKIDMHAHSFKQGDYLLFHDDVVGQRKIAYIVYLAKGFVSKDGGRLLLYDVKNPRKPAKEIVPSFNSVAGFKVSEISLHVVEEVKSNKQRLTVGGWFYGN